ncbi:hypothetical protein SM105_000909 [Cronobacter sakazakii]|nr:hypothetical protein [Cronobacter sakazakii]
MSKKGAAIGIVLLLACFVGSVILVPQEDAQGAAMVSACDALTKSQMKSPSTYKMLDSLFEIKKVDKEHISAKLKQIDNDSIIQGVAKGYLSLSEGKAFVDFEAQNSFGVPLKGTTQCNFNIYADSWASLESATVGDRDVSMADIIITSSEHKVDSGFSSKLKYLKLKILQKI